ncbi:hypothetical protein DAPPUDRAFT_95015 [Daphnia pulex]|uniref:Uncharacterized protein n=1 Tax=Daphnia pulex TaxID=6669 RepID=E9FTQ4_DAPPU|nr:hypothetical protein DAPPUDRAFT_95015 [Daphnia pulex]|eukprot:EFX89602.1 hypothetical protein DAPPUDRAFT_95015 [Daphnia pulex]
MSMGVDKSFGSRMTDFIFPAYLRLSRPTRKRKKIYTYKTKVVLSANRDGQNTGIRGETNKIKVKGGGELKLSSLGRVSCRSEWKARVARRTTAIAAAAWAVARAVPEVLAIHERSSDAAPSSSFRPCRSAREICWSTAKCSLSATASSVTSSIILPVTV